MATNIEAFCRSCGKCQTNNTNTQKLQRLLHNLPIPDKPWQLVGMDFMGPLPQSQGNDYLLVIIDWLTLQVHLVPTMMQVTAREVAWLFLKEVMRHHRVPESRVSDHDTKFTSTFWHELHKLMTKLLMSTAFHPQTDGATEWANHSIGQILRMIIHDDQKDWAAKCPMVEFALNSNVSATTGFAPFELNQGYLPQITMPMSFDTKFKGVKQFTLQVKWDLMAAHDMTIANHIQQIFHANKKCCASDEYNVGDHMYLSTQNLTLPKGRARKLVPKYIGPYKVMKVHNEASTVTLKLPLVLIAQQISPTFHMGLI